MNTRATKSFTRLELLAVVAAVTLLTIVGLATRSDSGRVRAQRINCVSNLKQVGLGFRSWANDHTEKLPWQVSTNQGGTLEYADSVDVWRHFQAASNELNGPKILACPADTSRHRTVQWSALSNSNISYFLSMNADGSKPGRILAGDRFVSTNDKVMSGLLITTNSSTLRLVAGGHDKTINAAMPDGSANQMSTADLRAAFSNQTVRLAIP